MSGSIGEKAVAEFMEGFNAGFSMFDLVNVVRCRDCVRYDPRDGFGCSMLGKWNEATRGFVACDMGADGFCAWGVRRES